MAIIEHTNEYREEHIRLLSSPVTTCNPSLLEFHSLSWTKSSGFCGAIESNIIIANNTLNCDRTWAFSYLHSDQNLGTARGYPWFFFHFENLS